MIKSWKVENKEIYIKMLTTELKRLKRKLVRSDVELKRIDVLKNELKRMEEI